MEKNAVARLPNGRQVTYCFPDSRMMEMVCASVFEGKDYRTIPFLKPTTIIDVGANVGCASLLFAGTYPQATIYALEPASEAFAYLERNTAGFPNVRRFNFGAFDCDTTAIMYLGKEASVTNSIIPNSLMGQQKEHITLRRLTGFLREQKIEHVSIIKMDTEGAELAILRDIQPMLNAIDAIMVEYHSESDRLEIDTQLRGRFTLCASSSTHPHRGTNTYVAKNVLRLWTNMDDLAIAPRTQAPAEAASRSAGLQFDRAVKA